MAGAYNTFETGHSPGTVLTGANSGNGMAGTAFGSNFYQAAGSTAVYDTASIHGSLCCRIELSDSSGISMGFAPTSSQQAIWTRGYFHYSGTPSANTLIHFVRDGSVGNSGFGVRVTSSGMLQFREHVNYATLTGVNLISGTWYRLELYVSTSGNWQFWLYQEDNDTPVIEESGAVASTAASQFNTVRWGAEGSSLSGEWLLDDVAWSDEGKIGPSSVNPPTQAPTRYVFDGDDWVAVERQIKR